MTNKAFDMFDREIRLNDYIAFTYQQGRMMVAQVKNEARIKGGGISIVVPSGYNVFISSDSVMVVSEIVPQAVKDRISNVQHWCDKDSLVR